MASMVVRIAGDVGTIAAAAKVVVVVHMPGLDAGEEEDALVAGDVGKTTAVDLGAVHMPGDAGHLQSQTLQQ